MKILITGGTGFIGPHLARGLIEKGHEVVLLDVMPNTRFLGDIIDRVKLLRGDITIWPEIVQVIKQYEIEDIFHLAALLSTACESRAYLGFQVNVLGTVNVLEAARLSGVRKVIFPSSVAAYGPGVKAPVKEDERQFPLSMYGATKVFCELWGLQYQRLYGIDFRCVRFPSIIGPGRLDGGASVYASLMIQKPALGEPYTVHADEETDIPILYLKDSVLALIHLYEAKDPKMRIYGIGGITPKASEIASAVKKVIPEADIKFAPNPKIVAILKQWPQLDYSKAKEELGWDIRYPLELLVKDFIEEIRSNRHLYE